MVLVALHALSGDRPDASSQVDLRPTGEARFTGPHSRQDGELQRPRWDTRQRPQLHHEARQLAIGQRGMMLTARPVGLGQHVFEVVPPERGVLARAQPHAFRVVQDGLDALTQPLPDVRLRRPDRLEHPMHEHGIDR